MFRLHGVIPLEIIGFDTSHAIAGKVMGAKKFIAAHDIIYATNISAGDFILRPNTRIYAIIKLSPAGSRRIASIKFKNVVMPRAGAAGSISDVLKVDDHAARRASGNYATRR